MITPLDVLVVDDERPALDELVFLLGRDRRVGTITACDNSADALRTLREHRPDLVLLDIAMPGLTGLDLAGLLQNFRDPPPVVFVTAHAEHAATAFDLQVADYVLKPVAEARLQQAIGRVISGYGGTGADVEDVTIPVELGGVTRFIQRSEIRFVEAQGDYARLHTADGTHLIRLPLTTLAETWSDAGFVRIHRSLLVALAHIDEVRVFDGRFTVVVGEHELVASRRQTPALREVLRQRRPGEQEPG